LKVFIFRKLTTKIPIKKLMYILVGFSRGGGGMKSDDDADDDDDNEDN
jgi:hypothetical protein